MRKGRKRKIPPSPGGGRGDDAAKENPQSAFTPLIIPCKCDRNMLKKGNYKEGYAAVNCCKRLQTIVLLAAM